MYLFAQLHGLQGILVSWPGIKPTSPALQGGFLTTGPGKSFISLSLLSYFEEY